MDRLIVLVLLAMWTAVLGVLLLAAALNLTWGWDDWRAEVQSTPIPMWRRTIATIGLFAVTLQAILIVGHFGRLKEYNTSTSILDTVCYSSQFHLP